MLTSPNKSQSLSGNNVAAEMYAEAQTHAAFLTGEEKAELAGSGRSFSIHNIIFDSEHGYNGRPWLLVTIAFDDASLRSLVLPSNSIREILRRRPIPGCRLARRKTKDGRMTYELRPVKVQAAKPHPDHPRR